MRRREQYIKDGKEKNCTVQFGSQWSNQWHGYADGASHLCSTFRRRAVLSKASCWRRLLLKMHTFLACRREHALKIAWLAEASSSRRQPDGAFSSFHEWSAGVCCRFSAVWQYSSVWVFWMVNDRGFSLQPSHQSLLHVIVSSCGGRVEVLK